MINNEGKPIFVDELDIKKAEEEKKNYPKCRVCHKVITNIYNRNRYQNPDGYNCSLKCWQITFNKKLEINKVDDGNSLR